MTAPVAEGIPSMRTKQIHSKIYLELQHRITSGGLKPGDLLPSEAELCEEFDASRGPVRQAIASLRAEGLISSGRGRRSVVLGTSKADSFMSILSNFAWMKEHDLNPTSKILWMARRPAPAHVAAALGMKPDDPIIFVSRVLFAESRPLILERQYFPLEVGMHVLAMEPGTDDIHEELIREGINFDSCRRSIEFVQADEEMARLLELEVGTTLIGSRLEVASPSGTPVEYAEYLYPATHLSYTITVVNGESTPLHTSVLPETKLQWSYDESGF